MTFALCAVATLLVLFLTGLHRRKIEAVPFESVDEAAATQPRMRIDEVV